LASRFQGGFLILIRNLLDGDQWIVAKIIQDDCALARLREKVAWISQTTGKVVTK